MNSPISRRALLTGGAATVAAAGAAYTAYPASAAAKDWRPRWAPEPGSDGLNAFEGIEDDRANSHPAGQPHIRASDAAYRFDMHRDDEDTISGRQRQEVKGMRTTNGEALILSPGSKWRLSQQVYIPYSLKATTAFTHITQLFTPDVGPAMMVSLRLVDGEETIELKDHPQKIVVARTPLPGMRERWINMTLDITVGDAPNGAVRWVVRDGSTTVLDESADGLGTTLQGGRIRPKWGLYRSLENGKLQGTTIRFRNMRAFEWAES